MPRLVLLVLLVGTTQVMYRLMAGMSAIYQWALRPCAYATRERHERAARKNRGGPKAASVVFTVFLWLFR
ncbi:MAG: hypothetical protein ACRC0H_05315, partial [Aeromonas sobria]